MLVQFLSIVQKLIYPNFKFSKFKILRMILNVKWSDFKSNESIHLELKVPFIYDFFLKLTSSFYNRCKTHQNQLVKSLGQ